MKSKKEEFRERYYALLAQRTEAGMDNVLVRLSVGFELKNKVHPDYDYVLENLESAEKEYLDFIRKRKTDSVDARLNQ